ncbi:hypothetical protein BLNAU_10820 [Blattamonas nauphoetae]|uniref:Uncharacterized protein n=1 Tax=Blattamonas nauphoetae TaxID=2049346 RepID=A0ABQ9XQ27_9EUKA|nr:hypothetical protein BLNAU_10820 [Blattamonas nauphoetae]
MNHARCGLVQLPCPTLMFGNERVKETGKRIVLSTDSSLAVVFTTRFTLQTIVSRGPTISIACSSSATFGVDIAANTLTLDRFTITQATAQPISTLVSVSNTKRGTLESTDGKIQQVSSSSSLTVIDSKQMVHLLNTFASSVPETLIVEPSASLPFLFALGFLCFIVAIVS